jgi:PqqD family protein of HPr-rel-A system
MQTKFQAARGLRMVALDDDAVVFNPFSWETHVLNPAAAIVLEFAAAGPACTEAGVSEVLAEVLDEDERPHAAEHARHVLAQLRELRLLTELTSQSDAGA